MEAPGGERRNSSYSFLTSARDGGEWSASRPGRALPPGKGPTAPIVQEAGWAPEPVWTQRLEEKSSASVGDRTPIVQSVVSHYTDWDTAAPIPVQNGAKYFLTFFRSFSHHKRVSLYLRENCFQVLFKFLIQVLRSAVTLHNLTLCLWNN
jgi:hypothetical protein